MLSLIKRNLTIYFSSRSTVFFSILAALISFVLYLVFLQNNMQQSWHQVPDAKKLLDDWLIGGTLAVTGLTSIGVALGQLVTDRETHRLADLQLTDLSMGQIQAAYLIGAVLIGTLNQIIAFLIMNCYFEWSDGISGNWHLFWAIVLLALFSSVVWTALNLLVYSSLRKMQTLSTVASIMGTISGFFAGVYVPIEVLPSVAQTVMKLTPAPYISATFREVLLQQPLATAFKHLPAAQLSQFRLAMGIDLKVGSTVLSFNQLLMVLCGFLLLFMVIMVAINYLKRGVQRDAN